MSMVQSAWYYQCLGCRSTHFDSNNQECFSCRHCQLISSFHCLIVNWPFPPTPSLGCYSTVSLALWSKSDGPSALGRCMVRHLHFPWDHPRLQSFWVLFGRQAVVWQLFFRAMRSCNSEWLILLLEASFEWALWWSNYTNFHNHVSRSVRSWSLS